MQDAILLFIQSEKFLLGLELFTRLVIAVLCGAFIGYERTNRGKEAGIRTHTIVAVASCLMMIISQYGFEDFFQNFNNPNVEMRLDPSRVAAQIVSGIGFLGAGMIFIQKNVVTGLTTAAGIWAVAGIGMAIGCGMYFIGIACAIIIVIVQFVMHKSSKLIHNHEEYEMAFTIENSPQNVEKLMMEIKDKNITVLEAKYQKKESNLLDVLLVVHYEKLDKNEFLQQLYNQDMIKSVKF